MFWQALSACLPSVPALFFQAFFFCCPLLFSLQMCFRYVTASTPQVFYRRWNDRIWNNHSGRYNLRFCCHLTTVALVSQVIVCITAIDDHATRVGSSVLGDLSTVAITPAITPSAGLLPRAEFIAQNRMVFSLDLNETATDPSYRSC